MMLFVLVACLAQECQGYVTPTRAGYATQEDNLAIDSSRSVSRSAPLDVLTKYSGRGTVSFQAAKPLKALSALFLSHASGTHYISDTFRPERRHGVSSRRVTPQMIRIVEANHEEYEDPEPHMNDVPPLPGGVEVRLCTRKKGYCGQGGALAPAAWILCRWLAMSKDSFRGKRVLELGCGTGFVGFYAAALGASKVTCTDNHNRCLRLAATNAEHNQAIWDTNADVSVVDLSWNEPTEELGEYDWILGSDLVYEALFVTKETKFELCNLIAETMKRQPNCRAVLAIQERMPDTLKEFEEAANTFGLNVATLHKTPKFYRDLTFDGVVEGEEEIEIVIVELLATENLRNR
jgi:2-polyprenyl-3-methyl-5-hydroxy-6-metoxy-1,4-benzoquinol methylase